MRRLASTFLILFLLALFLPLAIPPSHANAPPAPAALMRIAPVVVNAILPSLNAQARDTLDTTGGIASQSVVVAADTADSIPTSNRAARSRFVLGCVIAVALIGCVIAYLSWRGDPPDETHYDVRGSRGAT